MKEEATFEHTSLEAISEDYCPILIHLRVNINLEEQLCIHKISLRSRNILTTAIDNRSTLLPPHVLLIILVTKLSIINNPYPDFSYNYFFVFLRDLPYFHISSSNMISPASLINEFFPMDSSEVCWQLFFHTHLFWHVVFTCSFKLICKSHDVMIRFISWSQFRMTLGFIFSWSDKI